MSLSGKFPCPDAAWPEVAGLVEGPGSEVLRSGGVVNGDADPGGAILLLEIR